METGLKPCWSCGAPMRWVTTVAGKKMPLDPEPSPQGNVAETPDGWKVLAGAELEKQRRLSTLLGSACLYTSHFATCPNAARHRKK